MTTGASHITRLEGLVDAHQQLVLDVRAGLAGRPKSLPPRYFYDAAGSALFERITQLPEYYPTRTETSILERCARELVARAAPEEIAEFGSGSSRKTRLLLEAMHDLGLGDRYDALDVSEPALRDAAERLGRDLPWLRFEGVVGDFGEHLVDMPRHGRRLLVLLGSTIGNLDPDERVVFYRRVATMLEPGDRFLCGYDLVKDAAVLEAAYDDAEGVTREFNLNVLRVLDRELGGDLPVDAFEHRAPWNAKERRIEMRLRARRPVDAHLPGAGLAVHFDEGEELLTEISCKFTRDQVETELAAAGLRVERWETDDREWFALGLIAQG